MRDILNYKEFIELKEKYENLTMEMLRKKIHTGKKPRDILEDITGFGHIDTCTLCKATADDDHQLYNCNNCMWSLKEGIEINYKINRIFCGDDNYEDILISKTRVQLYDAVKERIPIMNEVIEIYKELNNENELSSI